jgi:phytoene dehydrogenase-like protein
MADTVYDVAVIGAGHNGLVCAAYLGRAGLKVKLVESRPVVGGAAVTGEFHPGYRNSVYAYVAGLLDQTVIDDLGLARHGLTIIERTAGRLNVLPGGEFLWLSPDPAITKGQLAKFSDKDPDIYDEFERRLIGVAGVLRALARRPPPNLGGGWRDALGVLDAANRVRKLAPDLQAALIELMTMSIGDYLDQWFEGAAIKGDLGYEGVIGNFVGPYQAGSAYVLLHHMMGEVNGKPGAWGHARGGMGAITQAMAKSAAAAGAHIETEAPVAEVLTEKGRAAGIVLADGRTIRARAVASSLNPGLLFTRMVDPALLPNHFRRRMDHWRSASGTFRINVALSELPAFTALKSMDDAARCLNGTVNICPSLDYIQRAYDDARIGGWARKPIISMCIPSTIDDTLAPPGHHVASLFCQHFNPELPDGGSWDDVKDRVADLIVDTVDEFAPNFRASAIARQVTSPLDMERDLGMTGGDIFHGALHLDQIYSLRPAAGYADYRAPVAGLYLCGSGAHPGGGVTGLPGRNAARAIIGDFRKRRRSAGGRNP